MANQHGSNRICTCSNLICTYVWVCGCCLGLFHCVTRWCRQYANCMTMPRCSGVPRTIVWCIGIKDQHMWVSTCTGDICVVLVTLPLLCGWWVTTGYLQRLARYCMLARLLLLRESWSLSPSLPEAPSLAIYYFCRGGGVQRRHSRHTSMALPTMLITVGQGLYQALRWSCGGFGCRKKGKVPWRNVACLI